MEYSIIQKLIGKIALINNKYESITKATGDNYNIFQVLRIETKEVITHSRMIADLLNPKGWHGMGSQFLKLFFDNLNIEKPQHLEQIVCTAEKNYGPIDNEKIKGGNIDLILEGLEKPIVIENKIFAVDQPNQLLRYHNLFGGNCHLYYLTLYGSQPREFSNPDSAFKITTISYSKDILMWLDACYQLSINRPLLRETLKQYINVLRILTGQSMNDEKNKEVFDFIEEHKESLAALHMQLNSFTNIHLNKLIRGIVEEIKLNDTFINLNCGVSSVFIWEGLPCCHFTFGNKDEVGIIFELKVFPQKLSLWTTAWRWDGKDTYGTDMKLINALNEVNRYDRPLDSKYSAKELAEEVIKGLVAAKEYYETLKT